MVTTGEKLVLSVPEAGKLLGVSRATAYMLAKTGQIPVIRLGKRVVVPKVALEEMLNVCPAAIKAHAVCHWKCCKPAR